MGPVTCQRSRRLQYVTVCRLKTTAVGCSGFSLMMVMGFSFGRLADASSAPWHGSGTYTPPHYATPTVDSGLNLRSVVGARSRNLTGDRVTAAPGASSCYWALCLASSA